MIVAALALAAFAGCAGEVSNEEYGRELRQTMNGLEQAYGDASDAMLAGDAQLPQAEAVAQLRTAQIALRDAGNQLESITPPAKLAKDHDALVAGVRDMADAVDLLIKARETATSDRAGAGRLAQSFAQDDSFARVAAAAARLEDAGVDTGL